MDNIRANEIIKCPCCGMLVFQSQLLGCSCNIYPQKNKTDLMFALIEKRQKLSRAQRELKTIKKHCPLVWEAISKGGCPSMIGLEDVPKDYCSMSKCKECWEDALSYNAKGSLHGMKKKEA